MNLLYYSCLLVLTLCGYQAHAQIEKGTQYWGGTVSGTGNFSSTKSDLSESNNNNNNQLGLKLQWGTFTKANFMVGVGANFGYNPSVTNMNAAGLHNKTLYQNYSYSLAPFVRWYKPLNERILLFLEPSLAVGGVTNRTVFTSNDSKNRNNGSVFRSSLTVVPGVSYRLGKRFALEADINVLHFGLNFESGTGYRNLTFASSVSSTLNNLFSLRGAFYLN